MWIINILKGFTIRWLTEDNMTNQLNGQFNQYIVDTSHASKYRATITTVLVLFYLMPPILEDGAFLIRFDIFLNSVSLWGILYKCMYMYISI